jgi:putative MFS transporter
MNYSSAGETTQVVNPVARLDRLTTTRFHILWILLLGLGYLIETFDNIVFGSLAPSIRAEWGLSIGQIGVITSAVFIGMMVGAIGGGRLSDRFGRKPVLIWASVFYSVFSLMSAIAQNYEMLLVSRILTGIGVQAATGVIMVYISEMFPRVSRGRFFTVMMFFGALGAPATSFAALGITSGGPGSWRWVFVMGSVGIIVAVAVALGLPDTVRWLTLHGKAEKADSVVGEMERVAERRGPLAPVAPPRPEVPQGSFRELFKPTYARRLAVLGTTFGVLVFCLYGFQSWVPTILVGRGLAHGEALRIASVISLAPLAGPVALFAVADRIERKTAILLEGLLGGVGLIVFALVDSITAAVVAGLVVQFALTAASASFYTYLPEVFPTEVRGVGAGVVNGVGRVAGIVSGIAVAAIYSSYGAHTLYLALGAALIVMGVGASALGPRTTRRSLETISPG